MNEPQSIGRMATFRSVGQPMQFEDAELAQPGPGEAIVRIECCTICGSDLHTWSGRRNEPLPTILGHEIIGIIESACPSVTDHEGNELHRGDRVTWSVAASCHQCSSCRTGMPQKCDELFKYGHSQLENGPFSGGLATHCWLRKGTAIVRIPVSVPHEVICPANCATATVAAAFRAAGPVNNKRVLVFGAGMLGLTASAMASINQAKEICICDPHESRLSRARDFGATRLNTAAPDSEERFDVVFEMSGNELAVESSFASAATGARVILVGSVKPSRKVAIDPEQVVRRLLTICGVHNYIPADLLTAVRFLEQHHDSFPFANLVERTFSLSEVNEAFHYAEHEQPIRVAIRPECMDI